MQGIKLDQVAFEHDAEVGQLVEECAGQIRTDFTCGMFRENKQDVELSSVLREGPERRRDAEQEQQKGEA